jgi:hypothetical protein
VPATRYAPPLRHRVARDVALELSGIAGGGCAAVVLANPLTHGEVGRATVGPCAPMPAGALVDLVPPTEPSVCQANRTHDATLRGLAETWGRDRMLLVPCTFGNDLLAVGVAPLGEVTDLPAALRAAGDVAEKAAAALVMALLAGESSTVADGSDARFARPAVCS